MDEITEFLDSYPAPIAADAQRLREFVRDAVPSAVERLRPGWRPLRGARQLLALARPA